MARAGLTPGVVTGLALEVLDRDGPAGLTLKAVAERAGVAPPSLYKHVQGLDGLHALMVVVVLNEAADRLGAAVMGLAGEDALRAFLAEFRAYARQYPHRHTLVEQAAGFAAAGPAAQAAAARTVEVAYAVVRGYGFQGDDLVHAVRALRAVVTGFVGLEMGAGYQMATTIDDSFAFVVDMLATGLSGRARAAAEAVVGTPGDRGAEAEIEAEAETRT